METENWRGINIKGGQADIHDNTFVFQEKSASIFLDEQPPDVESFKGRQDERKQIQAWLQDATIRLIGITAPGGYGKTFLAAQIGQELPLPSAQKLWVSFTQPYSFGNFGRWLLQKFGQPFNEKITDEELLLVMVRYLSERGCLLVMDNLETLLNDGGEWQEPIYGRFFDRWLSHGRDGVILLTSRARFLLPDNRQEKVRWYPLHRLTIDAGIALLEEKGIRGEPAELEQFVELVDGHPLSLSLTAGWLANSYKSPTLKVTYALQRDDLYRFKQIVGEHRGDRKASVEKILAASVQQLSPNLQTLWHNLSVYQIPFDLAAARFMEPSTTLDAPQTLLDSLQTLVWKSLLQERLVEGDAQTVEERLRFEFLPLVQRFAQLEGGDLTKAHTQAVAYYRSVAKPEPWERLENITAYLEAFHHLCELGQHTEAYEKINECYMFTHLQGYNKLRLGFYGRLAHAWSRGTWQIEKGRDLEALLGAILIVGNSYHALAEYLPAIKIHELLLKLAHQCRHRYYKSAALNGLGNAYSCLDKHLQAIKFYQQRLKIAREIEDREVEGASLGSLGDEYSFLKEYQKAIDFHQQSLEIAQKNGYREGEANCLGNLGLIYYSQGHYEQAIESYNQELGIVGDIRYRQGEAKALSRLGMAYFSLKRFSEANDFLHQALEIEREIDDRRGEASTLGALGKNYACLGDYPRAIEFLEQSSKIAREIEDYAIEAISLGDLGNAYNSLGQHSQAIDYYQKSLEIAQKIGYREGVANYSGNLGRIYLSLGQYQEAIEFLEQAVRVAKEIGNLPQLGIGLYYLQLAYTSLGHYPQLIDFYQRASEIAQDIKNPQGEADALFDLGVTQEKIGQSIEAMQNFQQAKILYSSLKLETMVQNCDQAIGKLSTPPTSSSSTHRRSWLRRFRNWLLRASYWLWRRVKIRW